MRPDEQYCVDPYFMRALRIVRQRAYDFGTPYLLVRSANKWHYASEEHFTSSEDIRQRWLARALKIMRVLPNGDAVWLKGAPDNRHYTRIDEHSSDAFGYLLAAPKSRPPEALHPESLKSLAVLDAGKAGPEQQAEMTAMRRWIHNAKGWFEEPK